METMYTTMSIASVGDPTLPSRQKKIFAEKATNDISDIEGSKSSSLKYKHFFNKEQQSNADVPGATSKILHRARNVRDNSLYIDDIDGTRHLVKDRMMRTSRHINPLEPHYPLPTYKPAEYPETRFTKDPQMHEDIEGSFPRPQKSFETRDIMSTSDIVGAQANWKPRHVKCRTDGAPRDILDVADISARNHRYIDKTHRSTNILDPHYTINGMEYKTEPYMKPKEPKKYIADNHLLQTRDIPGAYAGYVPPTLERREYRNTNYIQDIDGAHADSIRHSIRTNRSTNPLAPVYQALDPSEVLAPLIPALLPKDLIKMPTLRQKPSKSDNSKNITNALQNLDKSDDLEPVLFVDHESQNSKPPTGRKMALDLSSTSRSSASRTQQKLSPSINFSSRRSSGRAEPVASDRVNTELYSSRQQSGRSQSSGRVALTPTEKRAERERLEEINLVRQLQEL